MDTAECHQRAWGASCKEWFCGFKEKLESLREL
jgi:hypothetical protein